MLLSCRRSTSVASFFTLPNRRVRPLRDYLTLARPQYWVKGVFIIPGVIAAVMFGLGPVPYARLVIALVATSLVSSANYVINGWFDASSDVHHPLKRFRPAALGRASVRGVAVEYLALSVTGLALSWYVSVPVLAVLVLMLLAAVSYNVPPLRFKDKPYLDVLSESVNDAFRLLIGWFTVTAAYLPPPTLVLGYWMGGGFLVTVKRLAEYRMFGDRQRAAEYRSSFEHYTTARLVVYSTVLAMVSSFFLGIFLVRNRYEYLLAMPAIWALFAWYLALGFREDSAAQRPDSLWREPALILLTSLAVILLLVLTFVDVPALGFLRDTSLTPTPSLGLGR